jgi:CRP-like cAMP-binding protein
VAVAPDEAFPEGNRIRDALPAEERLRLGSAFELVRLEMKDVLFPVGGRLDSVWFPLTGVASLLNLVDATEGVEVATIGNEGLVGLPVSWGMSYANPRERVQVQVPGDALRVDAESFSAELAERGPLSVLVQRYTQAFFAQVAQQVACNGLHSIQERCARWLLLTHDRVGSDEFPLTQEFLAQMLGARRPTVTTAAGILSQAGFIRYRRGRLTITDREGLEGASCECYGVVREVFDRLVI